MSESEELIELQTELSEVRKAMRGQLGKVVKKLVIRGREVEYQDALAYRKQLIEEIAVLEQRCVGKRGASRNIARIVR